MRLRTHITTVAMAAALVAVVAPAAAAGGGTGTLTADFNARALTYSTAPAQASVLRLDDVKGAFQLDDAGVGAINLTQVGGTKCTQPTPIRANCPGNWDKLTLDLGDGNDTLQSTSGVVTTVLAGPGGKTINSGYGDDTIKARNGSRDQISCNDGRDTVEADLNDVVASDCETVERADAPPVGDGQGTDDAPTGSDDGSGASDDTSGGGTADPAQGIGAPIGIVLPTQAVTVASPKSVIAHLACSADALDRCRGEVNVALFERRPVRAPAHAKVALVRAARGHYVVQQRRIGHRRYSLARGKSVALPVRVAYRGHYAFVTRRRRARAAIKVVQRDAAGKVIGVTTRTAWLPLGKKWSRFRGRRRR